LPIYSYYAVSSVVREFDMMMYRFVDSEGVIWCSEILTDEEVRF
jgi:hypothetical protein